MSTTMPWWRTLYELQHAIWPAWSASEADSAAVAAFLLGWCDLREGARVLDVGCGVGREAIALARRGCRVVGLDVSSALLAKAKARGDAAGVADRVSWRLADYRGWSTDERFDLVVLWDSTLNIQRPEVAAEVVRRCAGLLAPGGWLVTQQLRPWSSDLDRTLTIENASIGPGKTLRRYIFHAETRRLLDAVLFFPPGHEKGIALPPQALYLYREDELVRMLTDAGLEGVEVVGSTEWSWALPAPAPGDKTPMIAARGRKPAAG